eukprot:g28073.t1
MDKEVEGVAPRLLLDFEARFAHAAMHYLAVLAFTGYRSFPALKETMEGDNSLTWAEEQDDQERLWEKIESKRHILTKTINPSKLTAYLRQCKVIDEEDEDEILCSHLLTSRRARA